MVPYSFLQAVIHRLLHILRYVATKPGFPVMIIAVAVLARCAKLLHGGIAKVPPYR